MEFSSPKRKRADSGAEPTPLPGLQTAATLQRFPAIRPDQGIEIQENPQREPEVNGQFRRLSINQQQHIGFGLNNGREEGRDRKRVALSPEYEGSGEVARRIDGVVTKSGVEGNDPRLLESNGTVTTSANVEPATTPSIQPPLSLSTTNPPNQPVHTPPIKKDQDQDPLPPDSIAQSSRMSSTKSPSPSLPNALFWHTSEITGHNPTDPTDDGYGINGLGFKPTAAIAWQRSVKRKRQLEECKRREGREEREMRRGRRGTSSGEGDGGGDRKEGGVGCAGGRVRFRDEGGQGVGVGKGG